MYATTEAIQFDMEECLREELPFMSVYYDKDRALGEHAASLLEFATQHSGKMPVYNVTQEECEIIGLSLDKYYDAMLDTVKYAFSDVKVLKQYFDCKFLRKHGEKFIPYAKATFERKQPALYGRFDAVYDPVAKAVKGVYEFNGDTPVMLFESVNLQNRYKSEEPLAQFNDWWDMSKRAFATGYQNVAVACDTDYVEDMATCETIYQMFESANWLRNVSFLDLEELDFDHAEPSHPFYARNSNKPLDALFILSPWEEMIETFPAMLNTWERWVDNVHIFEPAWRWFMSHKGIHALMAHRMSNDIAFAIRFWDIPLIETYQKLPETGKWVEKPVIGRLSNNIRIWEAGELLSDTGGYYSDSETVFQRYTEPGKVDGRNNFILGMWMASASKSNLAMLPASLCFREFDDTVLSIANERFMPHTIVESHNRIT
jgi:glutathionylspermidine synthase